MQEIRHIKRATNRDKRDTNISGVSFEFFSLLKHQKRWRGFLSPIFSAFVSSSSRRRSPFIARKAATLSAHLCTVSKPLVSSKISIKLKEGKYSENPLYSTRCRKHGHELCSLSFLHGMRYTSSIIVSNFVENSSLLIK